MTALQNSSSAMAVANNSLDETIALITAGTEIVQDASKVGNGLRTISMRIRGMNEETEELDDSLVNIKGDVYELTNGKVSIMEDPDTYKSTYQVLQEISKVWDELTDKQQAQLLDKLFGKTRAQIGAAIISNFSQAEAAIKTMSESAGAADREMDIITNSLEYKINSLKETFTGIWQNLFNREEFSGILDFVQPVLNGLDTITEQLGLFKTTIAGIGIAATVKSLVSAFKAVSIGATDVGVLATAFPAISSAATAFNTTLAQSGSLLAGFGSMLTSLVAAHPFLALTAGAIGLGLVLDKIIETGDEANTRMNNSISDYEDAKQKVVDINTELNNVQESINTLEAKSSLTFVEEGELANLREASELLQLQANIAEKQEQKAARQVAEDTVNAYKKNFKYDMSQEAIDDAIEYASWSGNNLALFENPTDIASFIAGIRQMEALRDAEPVDSENWQYFNDMVAKGTDSVWDQVDALAGYKKAIESVPFEQRTREQNEVLDDINNAIEFAYQQLNPLEWQQLQFDKIFDHSKNKQAYQDLLDIAAASDNLGITAEDVASVFQQYPQLEKDLKDAGFTIDDLINNVNSDAEIIDIEKTKQNIKDKVDETIDDAADDIEGEDTTVEPNLDVEPKVTVKNDKKEHKKFEDWVDSLDVEGTKALTQLLGDSSVDTSQWDVSAYQDYIDTILNGNTDASETTLDLAGDLTDLQHVFSDTGGLTKAISDYKTQMNSLTTARDKWNKGELTTSDMLDLQQQFYDLNNFDMTNFGDGVQKAMETITGSTEMAKTGYADFREQLIAKDPRLEKAFDKLDNLNRLTKASKGIGTEDTTKAAQDILDAAEKYGLVEDGNIDSVKDFVGELDKQSTTLKKSTGIVGKFQDAIDKVGGAETVAGRALVRMRDNLLGLYNVTDEATTAYDSLKDQLQNFSDYQTTANNALKSSRSATGMTTEEIEKLTAAYRDIDSFNPAKLFEMTSNGIHMNYDEFKRLNQEVQNNTLSHMYTDLSRKMLELNAAKQAGADTSALENDIAQAQMLISQYEGLTSAYNNWLSAKSGGTERESYEAVGAAYKDMQNILDLGWDGDNSLNAYLDLLLSAEQRTGDTYADFQKLGQTIEGTSHSLMEYWQYDSNGKLASTGLYDFLDDVNAIFGDAYASVDENGKYAFNFDDGRLDEVANRFGTSSEMIELFSRAMIDAGLAVDMSNPKFENLQDRLATLSKEGKISPDIDVQNLDLANASIEELRAQSDAVKDEIKIQAEVEGGEEAEGTLQTLQQTADAIDSEIIRKEIQVELDDGATIDQLMSLSDVKLANTLEIDTSQVPEARAQLQELSGQTETTTMTVEIEASQFEALTSREGTVKLTPEVEEIPEQTGTVKLTPEVEDVPDQDVNANVHVGAVDPIPDQDATVNYHTGHVDPIPDQTATVKYSNSKAKNQTASVNYNTGTVASVPDQTATVNYTTGSIDPIPDQTATVNYTVNLPEEATFNDKEATVTYHVIKEEEPVYPDQSPQVNYGINAPSAPVYSNQYPTVSYRMIAPSPPSYSNISRTVTYTIRTVGSAPSGTKHAEGTMTSLAKARSSGSMYNVVNYKNAYADGKVALDADEIALVNELGTESIIRNGKWMLLPPGMHQQHLKKGDIILSAKQTQALLDTGAALGHGRAYAYGTLSNAYLSGSGGRRPTISTTSPTGSSSGGSSSSSGGGYSGGGSSGGSGGGGATGSADTSGATNDKQDEPDYFDWIELKIDRIQRKIESLKKVADSTFLSWTTRTKYLKDEMNAVTEEIDLQYKAYNRYIAQANSIQLDEGIKALVRDGAIDIGMYDSDTQDLIKKYQEFYEKALDCNDAISDLKDTLRELYQQEFESIATRWENTLQKYQHAAERMESTIDRRNAYASDYMWSSTSRNASNNNIKDYRKLISNALSQRDKRTSELKELQAKLTEGLKQRRLTKNSEAYFELLKQIQDVENEIDDLNNSIVNYSNNISEEYKNIFDSIANDYDNKIALAEHLSNEYNNFLELAQAKGYQTSAKYYQKLRSVELQNAQRANQVVKDLQNKLVSALKSGEIKRGSQAWYDMKQRINEAIEAQQQATLAAQEYANEIRQIKWDKFDYLQEKISDINDEASFFIDLMKNENLFDDKGVITKFGKATAGLRAMNYNIDMNQADRYAKEIKAINKEIAKDPSNTDLIKRKEELIEKQRESIKAAESEKQAIKSLISDGIKKELSYIKDLISQYNNALQSQKDLYDYQKKIKDQTSEISSLQKQLSAYANDVSEETRAKLQKIRVELEEKQEDLEQTEYERMVSDTKKLLDDFYNEYETALNSRLDDIDTLIKDVINASNNSSSLISSTISAEAKSVGIQLSGEMQNIWSKDKVDPVLSVYSTNFTTKLTTINSTINNVGKTVENLWKLADEEAKARIAKEEEDRKRREAQETTAVQNSQGHGTKTATTTKKVTTTTTKKATTTKKPTTTTKKPTTTTKKPATSTASSQTLTDDIKKHVANAIWSGSYGWGLGSDRVQKLNEVFGAGNGIQNIVNMGYAYVSSYAPNGYSYLEMRKKFKGYATGAKRVGETGYVWTQEGQRETYLRASDHAVLTRVGADDRIYNAMASENLWQAANNPSKFIANGISGLIGDIYGRSVGGKVEQHFDNISFIMPNVKNYDELVTQMQQDKKFEKLIKAMTVDQLNGKSSDAKYHFRFG